MELIFNPILNFIYSRLGLETFLALAFLLLLAKAVMDYGKFSLSSMLLREKERLLELIPSMLGYINLRNEPIFRTLKRHLDCEIPNLNIPCLLRKKIFGRLLTYKALAMRDNLLVLVDKNISRMDNDQLKTEMIDFFTNVELDWMKRAALDQVPRLAIDKFKHNILHDQLFLKYACLDICHFDRLYPNSKMKMIAIMGLLNGEEILSYNAVEKTLYQLNGEVSALTFEGVTCDGCDPECPNNIKNKQ